MTYDISSWNTPAEPGKQRRTRPPRYAHDARMGTSNVVREVSHRHAVPMHEIFSPTKTRLVVAARREAIYRLKFEKPTTSAAKLGRWFGRDHSTIMHALACYQELMAPPSCRKPVGTCGQTGGQHDRPTNATTVSKQWSAT